MVNVSNIKVHVDGVVLTSWEANLTYQYKCYQLVAVYQRGKWAYSLGEISLAEPLATLVANAVRSQRTALVSMLLNTGMDHATASDYAGDMYGKIRSSLESINPL